MVEKQIRVLVANHPRLMRELMVTTFADQPDIEIVGEVAEEADIPDIVDRANPDFLVISQERLGKRPAICDVVLQRHPALKIIAVASEHNYSVHYWASFNIHSRPVEPSEQGILSVLRNNSDRLGSPTP
jgi:chemotaxis response regulator CheB